MTYLQIVNTTLEFRRNYFMAGCPSYRQPPKRQIPKGQAWNLLNAGENAWHAGWKSICRTSHVLSPDPNRLADKAKLGIPAHGPQIGRHVFYQLCPQDPLGLIETKKLKLKTDKDGWFVLTTSIDVSNKDYGCDLFAAWSASAARNLLIGTILFITILLSLWFNLSDITVFSTIWYATT